jgi:hypothetical protein
MPQYMVDAVITATGGSADVCDGALKVALGAVPVAVVVLVRELSRVRVCPGAGGRQYGDKRHWVREHGHLHKDVHGTTVRAVTERGVPMIDCDDSGQFHTDLVVRGIGCLRWFQGGKTRCDVCHTHNGTVRRRKMLLATEDDVTIELITGQSITVSSKVAALQTRTDSLNEVMPFHKLTLICN